MVPDWRREEDRILGAWYYQTGLATLILTESRLILRDSKEDGGEGGPRVLVLYQEGWAAVFQADCGTIPGNSQRCSARYKFARRQQRWSLRPGVIPGVLEQRWSLSPGVIPGRLEQKWSTRAATRFQGIPSGVALGTNSPDDGGNSIYTSSSKGRWNESGSVIYTRVAWVTASTGSQLFKSLYEVIDLNWLYHVTVH